MNSDLRKVRLSSQEFQLLSELSSTDEPLRELLNTDNSHRDSSVTLELRGDGAERLRDRLTLCLAQIGFDSEYKPTETGRAIENLIDKLFLS